MLSLQILKQNFKLHSRIYDQLLQLVPDFHLLLAGDCLVSTVTNASDLHLAVVVKTAEYTRVALSHYLRDGNGTQWLEPCMHIRVFPNGLAEALSYQDSDRHDVVDTDESEEQGMLRKTLNHYLNQWLEDCLLHGHQLKRLEACDFSTEQQRSSGDKKQ